jgi:hypothetical protein
MQCDSVQHHAHKEYDDGGKTHFIYGLFQDAVSCSAYMASNDRIINE